MTEYSKIYQFNALGLSKFEEIIELERDKVNSRTFAKVGPDFFSKVEAVSSLEENIEEIGSEQSIDLDRQFKNRYELGMYFSGILPKDLNSISHNRVGLWSWLSAKYLRQVLEIRKESYALWSAYRYIPSESSFRRYRHLMYLPTWICRNHSETVARFFLLSQLPHTHSDTIEQLYTTRDSDFLTCEPLIEASLQIHCDKNGILKKNAIGQFTPGSARRLATILARQLQMTYDLNILSKEEVLSLSLIHI